MGFTKKTWKNRIAEYINRRLITMEDGSTNLVTVARDEGTISQEGDAFNAANMNDLEDRIAEEFEEINQSLTNINTYVGEDGKLHFVNSTGADTVLPFNPQKASSGEHIFSKGYARDAIDLGYKPSFACYMALNGGDSKGSVCIDGVTAGDKRITLTDNGFEVVNSFNYVYKIAWCAAKL